MAELRPYEPTWRDRIAQMMMGDGRASPERRRFVEGLLGSSGLGNTGMGVVDVTPVGGLLQAQEAVSEGDPRGAALAVLPIPGAARAQRAANVAADVATPQGIRAYHGSPHDFDRFDLSKIGTGEGAQVYGHGLYFADSEGVARSYRDALSQGNPEIAYKGKPVPVFTGRGLSESGLPPEQYYASMFGPKDDPAFARQAHIQYLESQKRMIPTRDDLPTSVKERALKGLDEQIAQINLFDPAAVEKLKKGHMYEVNIRANPEEFLDWDKPVAQQSQSVREALAKAGINKEDILGGDAWFRAQRTKGYAIRQDPAGQWGPGGSTLEESLAMVGGDKSRVRPLTGVTPEDRSAALREAGIPGIKYLDQGSRAAGEGSRNYVVFDENLIDILRKYGLVPGMIGGGAAANSFGLLGPEGQTEY